MLKVRLIIYVVVLAVLVFCLKYVLDRRAMPMEGATDGMALEESSEARPREVLLAQHMVFAEYVHYEEGAYLFKVRKYLQYDSRKGKGSGVQERIEFIFSEKKEEIEWREVCEMLAPGQFVLLCWSEIEEDVSKQAGQDTLRPEKNKIIRVNLLKVLTEEESRSLEL